MSTTSLAPIVTAPRRRVTIALPRALAWLFAGIVVVSPVFADEYWLNSILIPTIAMGLAGIGLNLLMGYAGLVSLGSAAFMSIGTFATYNILLRAPWLALPLTLIVAGLITGVAGVFFGLPSLRIKGFYLAASTLGAQFFFEWLLTSFRWFSNNSLTLTISAPRLSLLGWNLNTPIGRYLLVASTVAALVWLCVNIVRSRIGRDWMAMRDMDSA